MKNKENNRRKFLKNSSLALLSTTFFHSITEASNSKNTGNFNKNSLECNPSTEDAYGQGPFYVANSPFLQNNRLADLNQLGSRIIISGQVYNIDCSQVIPNTEIDIWHANHLGEYDNLGYNLRGKTTTNNLGFYIFETIRPGHYLNGLSYRPSHIHFKITPPGFNSLITQLYFEGDPYISSDAAASMTSGSFDASNRIIPLISNSNGVYEGTWDIILDGEGVSTETNNIHIDKGIIYNVSPNPFTNYLEINYGVFKKAMVNISAYNMSGILVAEIDEKVLNPGKYSIAWSPTQDIIKGYYFIIIMINQVQVHYIRVFKQ